MDFLFRFIAFAVKNINAGEVIMSDKLVIKRSDGGILPDFYDIFIGRHVLVEFEQYTPIT